ncbi:MAG: M48 family metallopeptidase [Eubacterium sp.]
MVIEDINVEIVKKNIKNMHLYVLPPDGKIRITAPYWISDKQIIDFVLSKYNWIKSQQVKMSEIPMQKKLSFVDGEKIYVWGKKYIFRFMIADSLSISLDDNNVIFAVKDGTTTIEKERYLKEWYRTLLKDKISFYLPKWEQITGLKCSDWQTKDMKTRWGTCNTKTNKLWFSLKLAKRPVKYLEYVILHELAHTRVPNHGSDFKTILNKHMPDWKQIQKELNESYFYD